MQAFKLRGADQKDTAEIWPDNGKEEAAIEENGTSERPPPREKAAHCITGRPAKQRERLSSCFLLFRNASDALWEWRMFVVSRRGGGLRASRHKALLSLSTGSKCSGGSGAGGLLVGGLAGQPAD